MNPPIAQHREFRLNRVFSTPLSAALLRLPITPNQITIASAALGIAGGVLFSGGSNEGALAGAVCYQLAVILDNCDGDVARAKNLKSELGGWLDILGDFVTDLSLFLGVALGIRHSGQGGPIALFTFLCLSGGFLHLCLVIFEKLKGFGPAVFDMPHVDAQKPRSNFLTAWDALREGDSSWLVVILALVGRIDGVLWFGGIYMQILWISAVCLNFKWLFKK